MRNFCVFFILIILLNACGFCDDLTQRFVPGELIVKFSNDINIENFDLTENETNITSFDSINDVVRLKSLEKIASVTQDKIKKFPIISKMFLLRFALSSDLNEIKKIYEQNPYVDTIFKNFTGEYYYEVNDEYFSEQWGLYDDITPRADVRAKEAWDIEKGKEEIIICIIDTGVDYNHPDLEGNIWINNDEIPDNNCDDDNNG